MNITKTMAEQAAIKMVEPITKKIEELRGQLNQIAYEAIIPTIPQDVLDCFKKCQFYGPLLCLCMSWKLENAGARLATFSGD